MRMDSITLEEALELFKMPRTLGNTSSGDTVAIGIGRFGPYVRYGSKFVSIKQDDPYTIELDRALELIAEKQQADAEKHIRVFEDAGISVLNGRYGPYITDGAKNVRVPKDRDAASLNLEECRAMLVDAPQGRGRRKTRSKKG